MVSSGSLLWNHRVSWKLIWWCTKYPMIADTGSKRKYSKVTAEKGTSWNLANKDPKPSSPCSDKAVQNFCLSTWKVELEGHTLLVNAPAIITRCACCATGHISTFFFQCSTLGKVWKSFAARYRTYQRDCEELQKARSAGDKKWSPSAIGDRFWWCCNNAVLVSKLVRCRGGAVHSSPSMSSTGFNRS